MKRVIIGKMLEVILSAVMLSLMSVACRPDSRDANPLYGTLTPPPVASVAPRPTWPPTWTPTAEPSAAASSIEITTPATITMTPLIMNNFRAQQPILGVALIELDQPNGLEQGLDLGVTWMRRAEPLSWDKVEPTEGTYQWEVLAKLESELLVAKTRNIQPIIEIQFTPRWARMTATHPCSAIRTEKFAAFADFMEQVITRYGSTSSYGVHYWQLGNELDVAPTELSAWPDAPFGCWGDPNDAFYGGGHYAEMLKVVYPRIKAVDPDAQVLMGGLLLECDPATMTVPATCANEYRYKSGYFLEGVLKAGGGDYFDIADVHSYAYFSVTLPSRMHSFYAWSGPAGGTGLPEKVTFTRNMLAKYGLTKPIFVGEVALKCYAPTNPRDPPLDACWDAAAAFVPRVYAEAYQLGVTGQVYYLLVADTVYYSLMTSDFTVRPMYESYKVLSTYLQDSRFEHAITDFPGVSGSEFSQNGTGRFQLLWSTNGTDQTILTPTGFIRAVDKFGQSVEPVNGQLTIGWSPIYLEMQ